MTQKNIAIAGDAAEGNGALTGWDGRGSMTRPGILDALAEGGLPSEWAPKVKSTVAHAGHALAALNSIGFVSRRDRRADWSKNYAGKQTRDYAARWIVFTARTDTGTVGDAAGNIVLTAELRDGSDDLHVDGHADLTARVSGDYRARRDAELYTAGDVTAWLRSVIINRLGGTRYATGYYIPAARRELATRLVATIAKRWGRNWASPPLPVATSAELRIGIARAFTDEISEVARKLQTAREKAAKEKKPLAASAAAALLRELADVDDRAGAYRVLCGAEALAPAVVQLRALSTELALLSDDSSQRFALLELDSPIAAPVAPVDPAVVVKEALAARQAEIGIPTIDVATLRGEYKRQGERSGLDPDAFKASCSALLNGSREAADWARVARVVAGRALATPETPTGVVSTASPNNTLG